MKYFILAFSILLLSNFTNAQERFMVRISNPDKEDYSNFYKKGYDIAAFQPGNFIDLVVDDEEFSSLKSQGFSPIVTLTEEQLKENLVVGKALDGYRTYEDLLLELQQIEATYSGICKLYDIGETRGKEYSNGGNSNYDNYNHEVWALKVSDNVATEEDEPCIYYMGAHHGREPISLEVAMYLLNHILSNYGTDPDITYDVDNKQIWFMPLVNPNGHKIVIDELDVWQRKNIADNDGDGQIDVYHADGVDPNRNYGWEWGGGGSSGDPGEETYRGPTSFSEPEIQAMRDMMLNHHFIAGITYHSHGELVLYPNSYSSGATARDHDALEDLAVNLATNIPGLSGGNYTPEEGWQLYPADGVTDDYAYGQHGIFSFTIELGQVFIPPAGDIPTICQDNLQAAMILLDRVDQNTLTGLVKDANTLLPVEAEIYIDGIDNTGVYKEPYLSDSDFGRYYRFLLDGNYDVTFSAYGYIPQTFNNVNINNLSQTILDVFLNPAQSVTVTGTVTDLDTGLPIENATIEILNTPLTPVTTNIDGEYTFNNVMEGTYNFRVYALDYATIIQESNVTTTSTVFDFQLQESFAWSFESGFETQWSFGGNEPWTITTEDPYDGAYCSRSGAIDHSQSSEMSVILYLSSGGEVSFFRKVSSETGWDFLDFYIDGVQKGHWSGILDWEEVSFPVTSGEHTFKWIYIKDSNTTGGSDRAWVDYIIFPPISPPPDPANIEVNPASFEVSLAPDAQTTQILTITNSGEEDLSFFISVSGADTYIGSGKMNQDLSHEIKKELNSKQDLSDLNDELLTSYANPDNWVLPPINKYGPEDNKGEETFGSWTGGTWDGGIRDRGNIFHITTTTTLEEIRFYMNITASTQLYFFVYEGTAVTGTFNKVTENYVASSGTGEGWYSSGTMSVSLEAGNYYYIGTSWNGTATYGRGSDAVPLTTSFGTLETGISGTIAGYPPGVSCSNTYTGNSPYYQTLVTNALPPISWLVPSTTNGSVSNQSPFNVEVLFDATGLTLGTYIGDLEISSNDPDQPLIIVPCTLHVGTVAGFEVNLSVFLEGPFNGSSMNTELIALDDFPSSQPFYDLYGYNGGETVDPSLNPDIVDWVLVELRDANIATDATPGTWLASQAGFVLNDGSVVGVDDSNPMFFDEVITYGLYVIVYTRNHLAVMSASELTGAGGIYSYDFSTGIGQAHGGSEGYKYLGSNVWGMISGDGNCDGEVTLLDEAPEWELQAGEAGYNQNDHNMDGQVNNQDKDEYLLPNLTKGSYIPE